MVAPEKYRASIAFTIGCFSCFAWLFTTASANIFCAQICVNLATLYHPEYAWTQWQVYLVYAGILIICTAIVIFLPTLIPIGETVFFWTSITGFVVSFVTLLAASDTKQSGSVVFTQWTNQTGWSDGFAFLLAVGQAMYGKDVHYQLRGADPECSRLPLHRFSNTYI
jgi:choline transport protein